MGGVAAARPSPDGPATSRASRCREEQGSALLIALAVMIVCSTLFAAVMVFVQVGTSSSRAYRSRTERQQHALDGLRLAMTAMRQPTDAPAQPDGSMQPRTGLAGLAGDERTWTLAGFRATCTGKPGSGAPDGLGGYTDRTVACTVSDGDRTALTATVVFTDDRGTNLGSAMRIVELHPQG